MSSASAAIEQIPGWRPPLEEQLRHSYRATTAADGQNESDQGPLFVPEKDSDAISDIVDVEDAGDNDPEFFDYDKWYLGQYGSDDKSDEIPKGPCYNENSNDEGDRKWGTLLDGLDKNAELAPVDENLTEEPRTADISIRAAKRRKTQVGENLEQLGREEPSTSFKSMTNQNFVADVQEGQKHSDLPEYEPTTHRSKALKQIQDAGIGQRYSKTFRQDKKAFIEACKEFGRRQVKPLHGRMWRVTGLKSPLYIHQILGAGFMIKRENDKGSDIRGGILADEMGLGKTVTTLAVIVNRQERDNIPGPTLIVAPAGVLQQWYGEIGKHCENFSDTKGKRGVGDYMIYKYSAVRNLSDPLSLMRAQNILLASYEEVALSFPSSKSGVFDLASERQAAEGDTESARSRQKKNGLLHRMEFHRIVLDESQHIRNPETNAYKAVKALKASHHWCLSGSILWNGPHDIWAPLTVVGVQMSRSYKDFKELFTKPGTSNSEAVFRNALSGCMMRRTHATQVFDSRIVTLPKSSPNDFVLEFNDLEKEIYTVVVKRFAANCADMENEDGSLTLKPRTCPFAMLTRLRQLAAHPLLISTALEDFLEVEDLQELRRLAKQYKPSDDRAGKNALFNITSRLSSQIKHQTARNKQRIKMGGDSARNENRPSVGTGKKYGKRSQFAKFFEQLKENKDDKSMLRICVTCNKPPIEGKVTSCGHIYCAGCLQELMEEAAENGQDRARCEQCHEVFDYTDLDPEDKAEDTNKRKSKPDAFDLDLEKSFGADTVFLPSTKTTAVKGHILSFIDDDPSCKIVVFSQWLLLLRILESMCKQEDWGCRLYHGRLNTNARHETLKRFGEDPNIKVLFCSLKAGGVGLNLTMASKVISIDPWFNNALEDQAFARLHRIGQTRETTMMSLCMKDSIDERLKGIKDRKQLWIDSVGERDGARPQLSRKSIISILRDTSKIEHEGGSGSKEKDKGQGAAAKGDFKDAKQEDMGTSKLGETTKEQNENSADHTTATEVDVMEIDQDKCEVGAADRVGESG